PPERSGVPVRGILVDSANRPVAEVSVTFVALDRRGSWQAFSSDDGGFLIEAVPPGRYRVLIASPGHVALDLKSVVVSADGGLNLSLSLVDYPLNFKGGQDDRLPREEPRSRPSPRP
ncbi:MAG TPA: carboxypeptidase-like regulatory domain-containing protein, partial [Candidatus Polarisedimenticolia bacterium]|nr:carboxypeptidase-like regulatory domain-containing protein [Candidatus Polarisedimenticolia bacterium]